MPRNFISKIDNLTHSDYIANELSINGLKVLGTGLDHHKICIENIKALLLPSKSDQHRPDGITMISNMVKDIVSGTLPHTGVVWQQGYFHVLGIEVGIARLEMRSLGRGH